MLGRQERSLIGSRGASVTDDEGTPLCENCGHPVPVVEVEKVVEKIITKELTTAERAAIIDASIEGELARFLEARAPQIFDDSPIRVAIRELDRRLPRTVHVSHLVNDKVDAAKGTRRKRRRDRFDG
jgi:hypothetical protein